MLATEAYFKACVARIVRFWHDPHMSRKSCQGQGRSPLSGYGTLTMRMIHCAPVPIE